MGETTGPAKVDEQAARLQTISAQLTQLPNKTRWFTRNDWQELYGEIETAADAYISTLVTEFEVDKAIGSSGDTKASIAVRDIRERRDKLALSSGTTDQIIGICQQILTFGAAGFALCIGFGDKFRGLSVILQKFLVLTGIYYFELVALSMVVLIYYFLQAHFRYPFLYFSKIGNAWPYFYYASVSRDVCRFPIQTPKVRARDGVRYALDFTTFAEHLLHEKPETRLKAELQQYFLLIAYQGYVQQFDLRLSNLFVYGFVGATTACVLLIPVEFLR
jgi:hypothetical protein